MDDIMTLARASAARARAGDGGANVAKPPHAPPPDHLTPFATFPPPSPWDQQEVSKRTRASDELVAHLHVDGRDPEVQRAASVVESATATGDMEVLKYALAEFDVAVRRVGGKRFAKPA